MATVSGPSSTPNAPAGNPANPPPRNQHHASTSASTQETQRETDFYLHDLSRFCGQNFIDPCQTFIQDVPRQFPETLREAGGQIVIIRGRPSYETLKKLVNAFPSAKDILSHHPDHPDWLRTTKISDSGHHITIRFIGIGWIQPGVVTSISKRPSMLLNIYSFITALTPTIWIDRGFLWPRSSSSSNLDGISNSRTARYKVAQAVQANFNQAIHTMNILFEGAAKSRFRHLTAHNHDIITVELQLMLSAPPQGTERLRDILMWLSDFGGDIPLDTISSISLGREVNKFSVRFISPYDSPLDINTDRDYGLRTENLATTLSVAICRGKSEKTLVDPLDVFCLAADQLLSSAASWAQAINYLHRSLRNMVDDLQLRIFRLSRALEVLDRGRHFFAEAQAFIECHTRTATEDSGERDVYTIKSVASSRASLRIVQSWRSGAKTPSASLKRS